MNLKSELVFNLIRIFISIIVVILPIFYITNLKIIFIVIFALYGIINLVQYMISKEHDYLFSLFNALIIITLSILLDINNRERFLALVLITWIIINSLIKLKKIDFYQDKKNNLWKIKALTLGIYDLASLMIIVSLAHPNNVQIILIGLLLFIESTLEIIVTTIKPMIKQKWVEKNDSSKKENNEGIKENKEEKKIEEIKEKEKEIEPEKEIYNIDENITYKEFTEDFIKKYKDVTPNIQFGLSIKPKINDNINLNKDTNIDNANKIVIEIEKEISEEELKGSNYKKYYSPYIDKITNETNYIDFNEYSLIKEYHENILYNKNLYFSKSLCPSLYLLSILNLALIKYPKLFPLQKNIKELKKLFFNLKLDSSIFKMSSYPRKILEESCQNLSHFISNNINKELTKFQTRLLSFKTSFYPQYKSMINLQNFLKHNNPEILSNHFSVTLKKTMRIKINVEREKIIEHAFNIINDTNFSDFIGYLEFEYKGEIGNGLGPTLEFYTLILDKIKGDNNLWYKTTDGSLYPKLIDEKNISKKNNNLYNIKFEKCSNYQFSHSINVVYFTIYIFQILLNFKKLNYYIIIQKTPRF